MVSKSSIPEEEFKYVAASGPSENQKKVVSQIARAKETIRKLPMFETYDEGIGEYDFEWPGKKELKAIT